MEQELGAFFHSTLSCAGADVVSSKLQSMAADTIGHVAMGVLAASLVFGKGWSRWWVWGPLLALLCKEIGDFARDPTFAVAVDCVWDGFSYLAGIAAGIWAASGASINRGS